MTASEHTPASASEHLDLSDGLIEHEAGVYGYYNGEMGRWEFDEYRLLEFARSVASLAPKGTSGSDALDGWQPIETAPKDGNEFLAIWGHQGNVVQVVKWNRLHKFWQSKGEPIAGFATNATRWHALPAIAAQAEGGETS